MLVSGSGQSSWGAEGEDSTPVLGFLKRVLISSSVSRCLPASEAMAFPLPVSRPPPSLPWRFWEHRMEREEEEEGLEC